MRIIDFLNFPTVLPDRKRSFISRSYFIFLKTVPCRMEDCSVLAFKVIDIRYGNFKVPSVI